MGRCRAIAQFIQQQKSRYPVKSLEAFAESQHRHTGIIVGRLQHDGEIHYKNHRKFLEKIDFLLEKAV